MGFDFILKLTRKMQCFTQTQMKYCGITNRLRTILTLFALSPSTRLGHSALSVLGTPRGHESQIRVLIRSITQNYSDG